MKQIVQNLKTGKTELINVPSPLVDDGCLLIKSQTSLVSLGTEKMLVNFGKANYFQKARQQPEKVKQVINKISSDGLIPTIEAVFKKLDQPMPLGYCNAGLVVGVGKGVEDFKIGDRVASNGPHAEFVSVPKNLVVKIPDEVSYEEASFTVIGSIALQGIRLMNPTFGETIVVVGLGLIGLITTQLLKANGCRVIGVDFDENKLEIANKFGISTINASTDIVSTVKNLTSEIGSDGVIITASSKSDEVISKAANMCRKKGRIVLVGVVGLNINRSDFYEKELTFKVSSSYGPGRYDNLYENKGLDYPIGYVRWTQNRNFQAILNAIKNNQLNVSNLITSKIKLDDYLKIYDNIDDGKEIACMISYDSNVSKTPSVKVTNSIETNGNKNIGIIGAGNFTSSTIIPVLKKLNLNIKNIVSSKGLSGTYLAKKYKIENSSTDVSEIYNDENIDSVIITTRHNLHCEQVVNSLKNNKHVFVEKPLALNYKELNIIRESFLQNNKSLMLGFNRRFSPFSKKAKMALGDNPGQINVIATMNSGNIPINHWVQDIEIGGGRIIGEACHYIDLISFFTNQNVKQVFVSSIGDQIDLATDNATIILKYENGSMGTINYFSNGHKSYSKERIEIYQGGKNIIIDNFRTINFYGYNIKNYKSNQNKGHYDQFKLWHKFIEGEGEIPIPFHSIYNTSKAALDCIESLKQNSWIDV